jgi:MFS family permease
MDVLMGRKVKSALYATLLFTAGFSIMALFHGSFWIGWFVLLIAGAGNFIYGLPVSFLSELLTTRLPHGRVAAAGFKHIIFGFFSLFLLSNAGLFGVINAVLFFLFDEWLRSKKEAENFERRIHIAKALTVLPVAALAIWGSMAIEYSTSGEEEKTNMIYLIH